MASALEHLQALLKQLPGLGYRSAERIALNLLVEKPERLPELVDALQAAAKSVRRCPLTGNLTEAEHCAIYDNPQRDRTLVCIVEHVTDVIAMERAGAFRGTYHVLHGKLSPIQGVGPDQLNFNPLVERINRDGITEMILALSNDMEGEATCHYIQEEIVGNKEVQVSRIGFGLPSGGGLSFADSATLKSALEGRRQYQ